MAVLWSIVAMFGVASLTAVVHAQTAPHVSESPYRNLRTLAKVLAHVESGYVGEIDQDALIVGAIRGLVGALDPHSAFLDAEEYQQLTSDTEGRFAGIGVEIDVRDGWLTVVGVFPGGPAARAGMRIGDRFLTIEGHRARDMPIDEAVRRMRGEPGTRVRVRLRRQDDAPAVELTLERAIIEVDPVEARLLPGAVLWLRIRAFQEQTAAEVHAALDASLSQLPEGEPLRGVLLDVRNNPGGLVDQAVAVADEFLSSGVIVSTRGRGGRKLSEATARRLGTRPAWPIVVLVNGFTASAAEILAAALRDHERATLVGERTFGKGSVQNIIELSDGSALKLTVARYYTPQGVSIQATGIEPDIRVNESAVAEEGPRGVSEADLEGHLRAEGEPAVPGARPSDRGMRRAVRPDVSVRVFKNDPLATVGYQTLLTLVEQKRRSESR